MVRYHVMPRDDGQWQVKKENATRASAVEPTKQAAVDRANEFGGDVLIHDKQNRFLDGY